MRDIYINTTTNNKQTTRKGLLRKNIGRALSEWLPNDYTHYIGSNLSDCWP